MSKPVIGVDVDDVVANLLEAWVTSYNRIYGDDLSVEDIKDWGITKYVTKCHPEDFYDIIRKRNFYDCVDPFPGALESIQRLRKVARVVFVTSCSKGTMDQKREWLEMHGFLPTTQKHQHDLVMASDKALIRADCIIDDAEHNVDAFPKGGFLIARPHNEGYQGSAPRVTLEEAVSLLERRYGATNKSVGRIVP